MDDVKGRVRERYGNIARQSESSCCSGSSCCSSSPSLEIGYEAADTQAVPQGADLGLGCGNPTAIADLRPGETVLDLGSGGGFDCFLSANAVGSEGHVIGVDMTEDMISRARRNAEGAGYTNVEFRHGEIEALPVEDAEVDVIISNCVINLVPSKQQAFAEAFRVLRPGGRLHVSDIVLDGPLPPALAGSTEAYVGCVGGAVSRETYLMAMQSAGFVDIVIEADRDASDILSGCCSTAGGCACSAPANPLKGIVTSLTISARKAS
ncbi:MAG: arsenite methyltransferase [candidate division WS1 bacterium]|jgi:SAM-dependent methyltransferase|nr:arsenite methyltransferase [candidate division WS1 bacterium]